MTKSNLPSSLSSFLPVSERQEGRHDLSRLITEFHLQLRQANLSTDKGKTIQEYAAAFSDPENAPQSAKALQKSVGGDFSRVRIAFKMLTDDLHPLHVGSDKDAWFIELEKQVEVTCTNVLSEVWSKYSHEVQETVESRSQHAKAQILELERENQQLAEYIDELQSSNQTKTESLDQLEKRLDREEQLCMEYQLQVEQLQQKLSDALYEDKERSLMQERVSTLDEKVAALIEDKKQLQTSNENLMTLFNKCVDHPPLPLIDSTSSTSEF